MNTQTLTGYARDLGAVSAGGSITAVPAFYPQIVDGVLLSSNPEISIIDITTGHFLLTIPQTASIALIARDLAGKVFFSQSIVVSNDVAADVTLYLQANPPQVLQSEVIDGNIHVIQMRRKTAAQWTSQNPILAEGQEGEETDTGKKKTGDGATHWNDLAYETGGGESPFVIIAGETLSGHTVVVTDVLGNAVHANATDLSHISGVIGITLGAAAAGYPASIAVEGQVITEPTWSWPIRAAIFFTAQGVLTTSPPPTGFVQQVAVATAPTAIMVQIQSPIVIT